MSRDDHVLTEGKVFEVHVPLTLAISQEAIENIIVTALSGGIGYWCTTAAAGAVAVQRAPGEAWDGWLGRNLAHDGQIVFDVEGTPMALTRQAFLEAIALWAVRPGSDLDDIAEMDANEADVVIQLALFREVVYG